MMNLNARSLVLILLVFLASPSTRADLAAALAHPERTEMDRKADELRKPKEVLSFLGIEPGMSVFDIFAGGGYYTEILSHLVGPEGYVVHYNNEPWAAFVKKATDRRFKQQRLSNVELLVAPPEALENHAPEFDAAMFVLGMHDIYYADPANAWVRIDAKKFTQGIFDLLKPGGILGVIDHNALPGTDPAEVGQSLHRMDPLRIVADLEAVGFVLEDQSEILANPDDDKISSVFTEQNRMRTDRSLLKFRKPK